MLIVHLESAVFLKEVVVCSRNKQQNQSVGVKVWMKFAKKRSENYLLEPGS